VLYQAVQAHWPQVLEDLAEHGGLPKFVVREFEEYFALRDLVRRLPAPRLQQVLPRVPVRHWICSLPWGLRALLGYDRALAALVVSALAALRQREQWQWLTNSGVPLISNATAPHRQLPEGVGSDPSSEPRETQWDRVSQVAVSRRPAKMAPFFLSGSQKTLREFSSLQVSHRGSTVSDMPRGNPAVKLAVTIDANVHAKLVDAAEAEGTSVSAWLTAAARRALLVRDGLRAIREWEVEYGAFTDAELESARVRVNQATIRRKRAGR